MKIYCSRQQKTDEELLQSLVGKDQWVRVCITFPYGGKMDCYIKINRKLVTKDGKVVAAIMAGVTEIDTGWIWKIWVDEEYRHQGLGTLLLKHYEKKAKEKGATKIVSEEILPFFLRNIWQLIEILLSLQCQITNISKQ